LPRPQRRVAVFAQRPKDKRQTRRVPRSRSPRFSERLPDARNLTTGLRVRARTRNDVKHATRWREKFNQIPERTRRTGTVCGRRKQLKKKMPKRRTVKTYWTQNKFEQLQDAQSRTWFLAVD